MNKWKVTFENGCEMKTFFVRCEKSPQIEAYARLVEKYGCAYAYNMASCIRVRKVKW